MKVRQMLWVLLLLSGSGIRVLGQDTPKADFELPFIPSMHPRMVAEWEPAIGVLIAWPPSIPHKLITELAKDTKLYILVENQKSKQEAIQWLTKWGVFPDRVRIITAPQGWDISWTRDWGPHAVFPPDGSMKLVDGNYRLSTPMSGMDCTDSLDFIYKDDGSIHYMDTEDDLTGYIAPVLDLSRVALPFSFTGGNVIADGQRSAFSTCIITNENRYIGIPDETFLKDAKRVLGIDRYNLISNFEEEGIQHIDCFMKMLDEERLLVARPPSDHPLYDQYEGIVNHELRSLRNAWGRPYEILRLDTDRYHEDELAAYTNALILNKTVYVPLFGIAHDSVAMAQWISAMPGYRVKGFTFNLAKEPFLRPQALEIYKGIGWRGGDALHCRTRAIWDPAMIYVSVNRIPATMPKARHYTLDVILRDYSQSGLHPESLNVMYRIKGKDEWKPLPLKPSDVPDHYTASIPGGQAGITIEYYVTAANLNGKAYVMPAVAPDGFYSFKIE